MPDTLDVALGGHVIGDLTRTRTGARFQYRPEVAQREPGVPLLSAALPVSSSPFSPEATASWFTGLLPEDRQRDEVLRRFALAAGTYFDLLREIGWECAGAVTIGAPAGAGEYLALGDADIAARLAALPAHPFDDDRALRVSLGGYQAKLLLTKTGDGWALPLDGAISTHILKPQPADRFPQMIAAEAWAMALAEQITATARTSLLLDPEAPPTIVVERFDRTESEHGLARIHQEDGAQATGIPPERKSAASGTANRRDPTLAAIAEVLARHSPDPEADLARLLQQVTINVVLGNTDAHAKNYGLLHPTPGVIVLSPLYDVVPATFVNPAQLEMGLRVDGVLRIDRVTRARLAAEGTAWGIPGERAEHIVDTVLAAVPDAAAVADTRYPDRPAGLTAHVLGRLAALA